MIKLLRSTRRAHVGSAFHWLYYAVVFGGFPFLAGATILWLRKADFGLEIIVDGGQLAIYAAGVLAASIPVMQKDVKESPFKHPKWFMAASVTVIMFASFVYGASASGQPEFARDRLTSFSLFAAGAALFLGFMTELVSEVRGDPDLWSVRQQQVDSLGDKVRRHIEGGAP